MISQMRIVFLSWIAITAVHAQEAITVLERQEIPVGQSAEKPSHGFKLTLAFLDGSGWTSEPILSALQESARILSQCGVAVASAELVRIGAPDRFRDFHTPASRELARALPLSKPAVYFVAGTRQRPAFDAEAIGRGNSRTRPELADTVWVTRGTRDLGIALAHEIAHVLMDSGEHSDEPGNLMRTETTPTSVRLEAGQCVRLRLTGTANGLLQPAGK